MSGYDGEDDPVGEDALNKQFFEELERFNRENL